MDSTHLYVALLAFIPGLINLGIFIYAYFILPKSKLSAVFSMLVFSAMIWQICEGFLRLTTDIDTAEKIYIIMDSGTLLLISSCVYFSLIFTKTLKKKHQESISTIIYTPSLFFIVANVMQWTKIELKYTSTLGFINVTDHILYSLETLYVSTLGILCVIILINYWFKQKDNTEKVKARLIAIGYSIPFIQGLITEIIFPEILNIPPLPLTTTSITIFSIASIFALKKHELLSYSPYKVSDSILDNMSDAVIISDNDGIIKYVNSSLLKLFGYTENELIGKLGYFIIADETSVEIVSKMIMVRKKGIRSKYEINMKTKNGTILNILISATPYENNNTVIGALSILHDITSQKKQKKELTDAMIIGEEKERHRLAFELHDGISQSIAAINMKLQSLKSTLIVDDNKILLDEIITNTKDSINEIRHISHNLYPLDKDEMLCEAIKKLISQNKNINLDLNFNVSGEKPESINSSTKTNIYRVLQEFINNSIKYSKADGITIELSYTSSYIKLEVTDNGIGFNPKEIKDTNGIGLKNMEHRIKIVGGTFNLTSELNVGTKVVVTVPY